MFLTTIIGYIQKRMIGFSDPKLGHGTSLGLTHGPAGRRHDVVGCGWIVVQHLWKQMEPSKGTSERAKPTMVTACHSYTNPGETMNHLQYQPTWKTQIMQPKTSASNSLLPSNRLDVTKTAFSQWWDLGPESGTP